MKEKLKTSVYPICVDGEKVGEIFVRRPEDVEGFTEFEEICRTHGCVYRRTWAGMVVEAIDCPDVAAAAEVRISW